MKYAKYFLILFYFISTIYILFAFFAPSIVDKKNNKVLNNGPYKISIEAQNIYDQLDFISDLHCDALLWNRDLSQIHHYGHVDFQRMIKSNIALQNFSIVTKAPAGQNMISNKSDTRDQITLLNMGQGKPISHWLSLYNRAIHQCDNLHRYMEKMDDKFSIIKNKNDLINYLERRKEQKNITAGLLAIEGAHCLEAKIENLDGLYNRGVRMIGPNHFFDNALGGSAHGIIKGGLTSFGRKVIKKMNEKNIIIDLAHTSPAMINDILEQTTKPLVVSHTGIKATHHSPRNLSDKHIKAIAQNGGLIGITFFEAAVGKGGIPPIVSAMMHVKKLVGVKCIALGSDFDGSVTTPFDITGLPLLLEEMLKQGFTVEEIKAIFGENVKRFYLENLPNN